MDITPLGIEGAWVVRPRVFGDSRGGFHEWLRQDLVAEATGREVDVRQANCSRSARGVVRGVHFTDVPPGQAKYVTCFAGSVLDVVVDVRVGSPTFGTSETVHLSAQEPACVLIAEGLGHAFCALEDDSVVGYLCSSYYDPERDREVDPLDPALSIPWPGGLSLTLSEKDRAAPSLEQARARGLLPVYQGP